MKKLYVKPEIEVLEIEFESYMATFSNPEDSDDGPEEAGANDRRGEWGNLWSED